MALLLDLVESLVMVAPATSPFVGGTGQWKYLRDQQSLSATLITFLLLSKSTTKSDTSLSPQDLSPQDLPDGEEMVLIRPALQTKSNQKWAISLTNLTYLFVFLVSMAF